MKLDDLRKQYSLMSDHDLMGLLKDIGSLREEARPVLLEEVRRRDLKQQSLVNDELHADLAGESPLAKSGFASSLFMVLLYALGVTFVLKLLRVPFEINLPLTLICFLVLYYVKLRKQRRS